FSATVGMTISRQNTRRHVLLDVIERSPNGASIEEIEQALPNAPTRRSLQRWLAELGSEGLVRREGRGRATRYRPARVDVDTSVHAAGQATGVFHADATIPLSREGARIEA